MSANDTIRIGPSTVVVVRSDGEVRLAADHARFQNVDVIRMNLPRWLMGLLTFVAKQQWKLRDGSEGET